MAPPWENGARRGTWTRCPGCTRFKSPGSRCPACACGAIPAERYGAARMLLHGGVDRFALAERVAALEPSLARQLEARYAHAWACVCRLVEATRRCLPHLTLGGFVEEVEDHWAGLLPGSEPPLRHEDEPAWEDAPLELLARRGHVPDLRQLAGLAEVNQGVPAYDVLASVVALLTGDGVVAQEAALAVTRWRVWPRVRLGRSQHEALVRHARAIFERFPDHSARAAVAWVRATGEEPELDLFHALRMGLGHEDADIRFECALCLDDEDTLLEALDSEVPERVSEARRALASLGSSRLAERLSVTSDAGFARDVLKRLPTSCPLESLDAVLTAAARMEGGLASELRAWTLHRPFAELSPEAQGRWARWARDARGRVSAEEALRFLEWAGAAAESRGSEAVRVFRDTATRAVGAVPSSERAELVRASGFVHWLALGDGDVAALLHTWARDAACAEPLLDLLLSLPVRLGRWEEEQHTGQAARLLMAVWERPDRAPVHAPLRKALRSNLGTSQRQELIDAVWLRFQRHPSERAELLATFAPWRRELWERQLASSGAPTGWFETWWRADSPLQLPALVEWFIREAPAQALPERLPFVWEAAHARVDAWPRSTSHAVSWAAGPLNNALREGHDFLIPQVERFLEWFPDFERRVLAAPVPDEESSYQRHLLEDIHVDVQMMRRYLEQRREDAERERELELRRRVEESRRRDQERQLALQHEEAERARQEAERRRQALEAHRLRLLATADIVPPPARRVPVGVPRVQAAPLDEEPLLPGARLATLMDYARLLKAMMASGDMLGVLASWDLSLQDWSTEAREWTQVMVRRPDVTLRLGQLMAAPWD
ncbi:hypothetical protein LY474_35410 [Myxococcus stipitatus]|uniref:hypothetical protein n=1 Tax=Myxococcus stipitatus TaxID=83455 RepID=UPI001F38A133|nr:hypothetical protein [Myxococcus stipitatus]MCE9673108.1 hypothetical protein [Myxococcus stipitatus]